MKTLERYIMARLPHAGFRHVRQFCEVEPVISSPTFYRLLARPDDARDATREMVARKLGFREWEQLIEAWKAEDVLYGLDLTIPPQSPPVPRVAMMPASKASNQRLSPELQRAVAEAVLRGLKERDIAIAIQSMGKKKRK